jgi:flavin-dependent dehydrogenase
MDRVRSGPTAARREVRIYGAGMSGLIAAINLAREGYRVTVHDREKQWGGDPRYTPSAHTTSILPRRVSEYIGIDITPAFLPVVEFPLCFHDTRVDFPVSGFYSVVRGHRAASLDALLFPMAVGLGVRFEFGSALRAEDLPSLAPGSIIACGLTPQVYELLRVPHRRWHGWMWRGACDHPGRSWMWFGDGVTEYGYSSSIDGCSSDLLFSTLPIGEDTLDRYRSSMWRHLGVAHEGWHYVTGAVPVADPGNPQLVREGHICCGTMSGFMDPLGWFGINGAMISGKIAAMAVSDLAAAQREFLRFSRTFRRAMFIKDRIWSPLLRPRVAMIEKAIDLVGRRRVEALLARLIREDRHLPLFAIPGFAHLGTCYEQDDPAPS